MGTRISFVTECFYKDSQGEKIEQLEADLQAYKEFQEGYLMFQKFEFMGHVFFAGALKNMNGYFFEWENEITDVDVSVTWISDEGETGSYMASTWDYKSKQL